MRPLGLVFVVAVGLYLPTLRYGFVQDDRAIIAQNPAAHSIPAAARAFDDPYWPPESGGGLYRPLTILTYAVDWTLSGGSPGWMHAVNALLHGVVTVLLVAVLLRWLPVPGAVAAGLVFALHPVHVEGVASLVSRAELLVAAGALGAVLLARRRRWNAAVTCAAAAMLSKEHGVVAGVLILLDDWLESGGRPRYPRGLYIALAIVTGAYLAAWLAVGRAGLSDVAPPFHGAGAWERLAVALPAVWRAATLLVWPVDLSADYSPQVIPARTGPSAAMVLGLLVVLGLLWLSWRWRRRAPLLVFAGAATALAYLPTSNLLFASGVVLAERALYLPVLLPAAGFGMAALRAREHTRPRAALGLVILVCAALAWRSYGRLPVWRDNKTFLTTLLAEHPESYRAHASAAAVLAGLGDTAAARREYERADSLFPGDAHLAAARAFFLLGQGDTLTAAPLVRRARGSQPSHRIAMRCEFLLAVKRGERLRALAVADSAVQRYPAELEWYRIVIPQVVDSLRSTG